ncbi:NACHT domain-containing protein [Anabaena sp. CCY 9910]|uniref:NACHT domain-containing protein n=1 Tax=Anabaena sp. CCY 9910 TaxID=3103870 RepID=UPI0039DF41B9
MPDAEDTKQVNNNDLRNAQFAGGLVNADNIIAGQIGGDNYNIYIGQPSQQKIDIDWHQVSSSLLDEHLRLTTNPLTFGEGITYQTEQVYVPLGLVERKKQSRRKEDVLPEKGSELYHETEITQTFEHHQFLKQVLRDRQSPRSQGRRIAIIGELGAGKTTLLQQIAQWVSKEIEQSVVIWVSLADLRSHDLESYLLEVWLQGIARTAGQAEASTQVKDDFVAQFNRGLVWLVLDGVDEMPVTDGNPLGEIERQIRQGGLLQQARIVISCRLNLWDDGRNTLDSFDNYRTLEFSYPQQVEEFICKWFGSQSPAEIQIGQQLCVALREPGKERIRDLVKNPLRLTLLCLNWHLGEGNLPQTKAGLYEQFVSYFYEWKKSLFVTTGEQRRRLNSALGELARDAIDKEAMRFRLRQEFVYEYLGDPDDTDSLFAIALRLGWLNKVGVEAEHHTRAVYAFFHPTFQEYFAALAIDDGHYFLNHLIENPNHLEASYRVFEAQWREIFLLWLGRTHKQISNRQKEELIKALIEFEDGCKGFYSYKAYFLAGVGIAEFIDCNYADEIIIRLVKWSFGYFNNQKNGWKTFLDPIVEATKAVLKQTEQRKLYNTLISFIHNDYTPLEVKCKIADMLGSINCCTKEAIEAITSLLNAKLDNWDLCITAKSLAKIDPGNEKAIETLINLALEEPYPPINNFAAKALKEVNPDNSEIINYLSEMLFLDYYQNFSYMKSSDIEAQRFWAAENLLIIAPDNQKAIECLFELFCKENLEHDWIRISGINILPSLKTSNQKVVDICNKLLEIEKQQINRCYIARILGIIEPTNQKSIQILLEILQNKNLENCCHSVSCLEDIAIQNKVVIDALTQLLNRLNRNSRPSGIIEWLRWRTAKALGIIDFGNPKAVMVLTKLLEYSKEYNNLAAKNLKDSLTENQMFGIVNQLKNNLKLIDEYGYENEELEEIIKKFENDIFLDIRINIYKTYCSKYEVLWHCSQNMTYPNFFNALYSISEESVSETKEYKIISQMLTLLGRSPDLETGFNS